MAAIDSAPAWQYNSRDGLYGYLSHVEFYGDRVVGQWFCLEVATGNIHSEKNIFRANFIIGVAEGVIVASEMMTEGCWTAEMGCYGISLVTGDLLWTSHGDGFWGRLWRALDFLPGFANDFRDTPVGVKDGHVVCASGRILDIRTGRRVARDRDLVGKVQEEREHERSTPEGRLYAGKSVEVEAGEGEIFTLKRCGGQPAWQRAQEEAETDEEAEEQESDSLCFRATDANGATQWTFRLAAWNRHTEGNFHAWRFHHPFIYIIAGDAPVNVPIKPEEPGIVRRNSMMPYLLALDVRTGRLIQEFALADGPTEGECRIEAISDHGLLLSMGYTHLRLYRLCPPDDGALPSAEASKNQEASTAG